MTLSRTGTISRKFGWNMSAENNACNINESRVSNLTNENVSHAYWKRPLRQVTKPWTRCFMNPVWVCETDRQRRDQTNHSEADSSGERSGEESEVVVDPVRRADRLRWRR